MFLLDIFTTMLASLATTTISLSLLLLLLLNLRILKENLQIWIVLFTLREKQRSVKRSCRHILFCIQFRSPGEKKKSSTRSKPVCFDSLPTYLFLLTFLYYYYYYYHYYYLNVNRRLFSPLLFSLYITYYTTLHYCNFQLSPLPPSFPMSPNKRTGDCSFNPSPGIEGALMESKLVPIRGHWLNVVRWYRFWGK